MDKGLVVDLDEGVEFGVVIPTYNRGRLLSRTIETVLSQELAPREIIVVDDGSTDDTKSIVKTFGSVVRYLHQANSGASRARNLGVERANCDWIAFLDSDDHWTPSHLSRIANCIRQTDGKAVLYFQDTKLPEADGGQSLWEVCGLHLEGTCELKTHAAEWAFMSPQPAMLQSSVVLRDCYLELGGLSECLLSREDTLFFYQVALGFTVCAVAGCGAVMNSDDDIRLTTVHHKESFAHMEATIFIYKELLNWSNKHAHRHRALIAHTLSISHCAMCRMLFREKKYKWVVRHLVIGVRYGFLTFWSECLTSLWRLWKRKTQFCNDGGL